MTLKGLVHFVLCVIPDLVSILVTYWPGPMGNNLRYRYYRKRLKFLGEKAVIDVGVQFVNPARISIGANAHINRYVTLIAGPFKDGGRAVYHKANPRFTYEPGEVRIGSHVHIAPYAYVMGAGGFSIGDRSAIASGARIFSVSNHHQNLADPNDTKLYAFSNRAPAEDQAMIAGPVVLEEKACVGLNGVVLPGSTIGRESIVGTLSSVVGDIPPGVIASGCPAVVVKRRE